jgi:hypothetical protein
MILHCLRAGSPVVTDTGCCPSAAHDAARPSGSAHRFLAMERARLFLPELFAVLSQQTACRSVPPRILAIVMVLQMDHPGLAEQVHPAVLAALTTCSAWA